MKNLYFILLFIIPTLTFSQNIDINTLKKINVNRNEHLHGTMKFISDSQYGVSVAAPVMTFAVGLIKKDDHLIEKSITMGTGLALNYALTLALKKTVQRDRPFKTYTFIISDNNETGYSFPSGHTSNAFCTATAISLQLKKWYYVVPVYAWASAVGYSRMYLGVHYPSDVAAGAILGAGSAWLTFKANQQFRKKYLKKYPKGYLIWQP